MANATSSVLSDEIPKVPDIAGDAQARPLGGLAGQAVTVVALALALFQIYTAAFGALPPFHQRGIHLGLALMLVYVLFPARRRDSIKRSIPWYDILAIALAIVAAGYVVWNEMYLFDTVGRPGKPAELVLAVAATLLVVEATRRTIGQIFTMLAVSSIAYALLGQHLPGIWASSGFSPSDVLETLYLGLNGIWGPLTGISAGVVAIFLLFGALLQASGAGDAFVDLARFIAGRAMGGPAKVSVVSSSLFGTISGSAVANVVVDGIFNIPLMKRMGYRPQFAAAVEATASTGGQLVPPVMGAGAFVMAELLNIPYAQIATAAALPALLYYLGLWQYIDFEARHGNLPPVPQELIPKREDVLSVRKLSPLVVPVAVVLYFFSQNYTAQLAAAAAIAATLPFYFLPIRPDKTFRQRMSDLAQGLVTGARAVALVAALIAGAQIVVGMIGLTGVGVKLSEAIFVLGASNLVLALALGMFLPMILGMGLPTTAAYVLAAAIVAPGLERLGVDPLQAHLFIFYFAILAAITPPVCAAVWVAAAIARTDWWRAGWLALRMALPGMMIPYFFVYSPALLLRSDPIHVAITAVTALVGVVAFAAGMTGYLFKPARIWERALLIAAGVLLIAPHLLSSLVGLGFLAAVLVSQKLAVKVLARPASHLLISGADNLKGRDPGQAEGCRPEANESAGPAQVHRVSELPK